MGPFASEIVEAARRAHDPEAADRARVASKLAARIAAESAAGASGSTTVSAGVAVKLGVPLLVVALAAGFLLRRDGAGAHGPAIEPAAPAHAAVEPAEPAEPSAASPPEVPAETANATPPETVAQPAPAVASVHARPQPAAATNLAGEMALLASAQAAIQSGDYPTALAKLDEHQRTYPAGVLGEERTAARVVALCGAGRVAEARLLATAFLARHPSSPLAPRVRSSCGMP